MKSRFPRPNGFSLVEVTIALGLISFGLVTMIGLMPTGLEVLRNSTQQTIDTQILQQISNDLVVNSFNSRSDFSTFNTATLYFNEEAQLLASGTGARYKAVLQDQSPSLPGLSQSDVQSFSSSLKRIGVSISRIDIPNASTNYYSLQIAYR